jgi:hypothetical protein
MALEKCSLFVDNLCIVPDHNHHPPIGMFVLLIGLIKNMKSVLLSRPPIYDQPPPPSHHFSSLHQKFQWPMGHFDQINLPISKRLIWLKIFFHSSKKRSANFFYEFLWQMPAF